MTRSVEIALVQAAPSGDRKVKFDLNAGCVFDMAENGVLTVQDADSATVFNPQHWQFFLHIDDETTEAADDRDN